MVIGFGFCGFGLVSQAVSQSVSQPAGRLVGR